VTRGAPEGSVPAVGLFGYSSREAVPLVLDAMQSLARGGVQARLVLLGSPGRPSAAADMWLAAAADRGIEQQLSFTGVLPAQSLSNELAACEVLLFTDSAGPSPRKGTLAGSLASGTAVVAVDGPQLWSMLVEHDALQIVAPSAESLSEAIEGLLGDDDRRRALGTRGQRFAEEQMGLGRSAELVGGLLGEVLSR
jgi:glycosyltransferase involved in cell wall biosynthesis